MYGLLLKPFIERGSVSLLLKGSLYNVYVLSIADTDFLGLSRPVV